MQENIHPQIIELEMTADSQSGDASPAYGPDTQYGQQKSVTVLDLELLVASGRQLERLFHECDAEVEGAPSGDQSIETIFG
jgi:hypothetical protein